MYNILIIHILKFIVYVIEETINLVYTLGTGIVLVRYPLYVLTEVIVLLDVLFYLNGDVKSKNVKDKNVNIIL